MEANNNKYRNRQELDVERFENNPETISIESTDFFPVDLNRKVNTLRVIAGYLKDTGEQNVCINEQTVADLTSKLAKEILDKYQGVNMYGFNVEEVTLTKEDAKNDFRSLLICRGYPKKFIVEFDISREEATRLLETIGALCTDIENVSYDYDTIVTTEARENHSKFYFRRGEVLQGLDPNAVVMAIPSRDIVYKGRCMSARTFFKKIFGISNNSEVEGKELTSHFSD